MTVMDARPYNLNNLRRAAEERRKAAAALTDAARRMHLDLAEIFEARAGMCPDAQERANVVQLRPKTIGVRAARTASGASASKAERSAKASRRKMPRKRPAAPAVRRAK